MPKFYFTYGLSPKYPFKDGWTEIEAPNRHTAAHIFRAVHPDRPGSPGILNCASYYTEEEFMNTKMATSEGNFGGFCHENITFDGYCDGQITFHRKLLDIEHGSIPDSKGGRYAGEG